MKTESILLPGILLLAIAARFYHLDFLSLWTDELWAVVDSRAESLAQVLDIVYRTETHPPGYHFFLHYWQILFGSSDFSLRLPSALAGVGIVWISYLIGRDNFNRETGLMTAALVAVCYQLITYSQEARANMLMAFFCLASLHALLLVITQRASKGVYISFWFSAALASYLHYAGTVFVLTLGVIAVTDAALSPQRKPFRQTLLLFFPVLVLYAPWIPGSLHHIANGPQELWNKIPTTSTLPQTLEFLFGPDQLRTLLFSLALLAAALHLVKSGQKRLRLILWACILIPIVTFYGKSLISQPIYNHRHFLFVLPLMYLLIVDAGMQFFGTQAQMKIRQQAMLILVIVIVNLTINQTLHIYDGDRYKHNYRDAVEIATQERDVTLVANNRFFDHYIQRVDSSRRAAFIFEGTSQLDALQDFITANKVATFYYVEVIGPESDLNDDYTTREEALASRFTLECRNDLRRTRALRFSTEAPTTINLAAPTCR